MKMNSRFILSAALVASFVLRAEAQTSWNSSSSGHWSVPGNWSAGIPSNNAVSILPGLADYVVTYGPTDVSGFLPFTSLTLGAVGSETSTTLQIGAAGFSYSGDGVLNQGGVLEILSGGVLNQTAGANGTRLNAGSSLIVRNGGDAAIRSAVNNNGAFLVENGGILRINAGNLNLGTGSTFSNQGTLRIQGGGPLNLNGGASLTTSGVIEYASSTFSQNTFIVGTDQTSTLSITGGTITTPVALWDRGFQVAGRSGSSTTANASSATQSAGATTNNGVLLIGMSGTNTSNTASTDGFLTISGGTWVNGNDAQANEYLQSVIVGGNLTRWTNASGYQANAAGGSIEGTLSVSGTGSFRSYGNVYLGAGGGLGTLNVSGGEVTIANAGSAILKLGVAGSALGNTSSSTDNAKGAITTIGHGTLNLSGGVLTVDRLEATAGHSTINFTAGTLVLSHSAGVDATAGLAVGDGTQAADLRLASASGNYQFTNGLSLRNNATLSARGTVEGSVSLASGAGLVVGTVGSVGAVAFTDSLTLDAGSTVFLDLAGTLSFDSISGGNVAFGGVLNLSFSGGGFEAGQQFALFDFQNYNGQFSDVVWTGLGGGLGASFDAGTGVLQVVPEPSSALLLLSGGLLLAGVSRRRRIS